MRAFPDVKLQWLSLLTQDHTISSTAKVVGVYVVTTHYNNNLGKAWPSVSTIAKAINVAACTVTRALKELERTWFAMIRGTGHKSTEYEPSAFSVKRANALRDGAIHLVQSAPEITRENAARGGKNATPEHEKTGGERGQKHPLRGGENERAGGAKTLPQGLQKCDPNQESQHIKKHNARARAQDEAKTPPQTEHQSKPVFVRDGGFAMTRWSKAFDYLHMGGKRPEDVFPKVQQDGLKGFLVPSEFPQVMPYSIADREKVNLLQETVSRFLSHMKRDEAAAKKEAEKVRKEERIAQAQTTELEAPQIAQKLDRQEAIQIAETFEEDFENNDYENYAETMNGFEDQSWRNQYNNTYHAAAE